MRDKETIEGPRQLGDRYWSELCDLVNQGEISPEFANRITDDLFEPAEKGEQPQLKWSSWCRYIEEQETLAAIYQIRAS